jgi:hypothetical protein
VWYCVLKRARRRRSARVARARSVATSCAAAALTRARQFDHVCIHHCYGSNCQSVFSVCVHVLTCSVSAGSLNARWPRLRHTAQSSCVFVCWRVCACVTVVALCSVAASGRHRGDTLSTACLHTTRYCVCVCVCAYALWVLVERACVSCVQVDETSGEFYYPAWYTREQLELQVRTVSVSSSHGT